VRAVHLNSERRTRGLRAAPLRTDGRTACAARASSEHQPSTTGSSACRSASA
jgi:hypothetical protein